MSTPDPATTDWVQIGALTPFTPSPAALVITDWNDPVAQNTGWYVALGNALNAPAGQSATGWYYGMTIAASSLEASQFMMRGSLTWYRRKGNGTWFAWSLLTNMGRGTGISASPSDGEETLKVDSSGSTTFHWRMRYTTSYTGAEKWEFVGGIPFSRETLAQQTLLTSLGWNNFSPSLSVAAFGAGDYDVAIQARIHSDNVTKASLGVGIGAAAPVAANTLDLSGSGGRMFSARMVLPGLIATQSLVLKYQFDVTPTNPVASLVRIEVTPRRFA
jgi:hypothetical protein